jgi:apolipoprotein N-acyltransferase
VGVYVAAAGVLLRRLAGRFPLALAAPAAWIGCETLRFVIEPPFAFGWMRLGTYLHDVPLLAGGARVVGVGGLGFVIASIGGGLADLVQAREWTNRALLALVPAGIVLVASLSTSAPATVDGPRVLLVQPAFEQRRKMESPRAQDLFFDSCRLTTQAIARGARAGEKPPDLVAWGETMFPLDLAEPGLLEKYERGARSVPWAKYPVGPDAIAGMAKAESAWIQGVIYGKNGSRVVERVLPPGTSFLTGAEYHGEVDGHIRRMNAILLWNADGERAGLGGKVYLVPGAEHLCGLERQGWVRTLAHDIAGYIPDLVEFD